MISASLVEMGWAAHPKGALRHLVAAGSVGTNPVNPDGGGTPCPIISRPAAPADAATWR